MEVHFLEDHEVNPQVQFLAFHLERRRISCSADVPTVVYNAPEGAYGAGSRQSLQRLMEPAPPFLHSDREGAFTACYLLFQIIKFCFALHSGHPLNHILGHQICKDLQITIP